MKIVSQYLSFLLSFYIILNLIYDVSGSAPNRFLNNQAGWPWSFNPENSNSTHSKFPPFNKLYHRDSQFNKDEWPWSLAKLVKNEDENKRVAKADSNLLMDSNMRVQMGVSSGNCDDGKTNLTIDWDFSPSDYTCSSGDEKYPIDSNLDPKLECITLPSSYLPDHKCMDTPIIYNDDIPTYGDHRPLWPKFGEYLYVPPQRWLHNIEHGAVVMLYHPCTDSSQVKELKNLVKNCYGKHIITPSTLLTKDHPMALVAWGCRLLMASVDESLVKKFIHEKAMKGPEGTYTKEGQFDTGLLEAAKDSKISRYDAITC